MSAAYFVPPGDPIAKYGFRDDALSVSKHACPAGYVAVGALRMNDDLRSAHARIESLSRRLCDAERRAALSWWRRLIGGAS